MRVWVRKGCHTPSQYLRTFANQSWGLLLFSPVADGRYTLFISTWGMSKEMACHSERQNISERLTKKDEKKNVLICFYVQMYQMSTLFLPEMFNILWPRKALTSPLLHCYNVLMISACSMKFGMHAEHLSKLHVTVTVTLLVQAIVWNEHKKLIM